MTHYDDAATWVADNIDKLKSKHVPSSAYMYIKTEYYCGGVQIAYKEHNYGSTLSGYPNIPRIRLTEGVRLNTEREEELIELIELWEQHQIERKEEERKRQVAEEFYKTMNHGCEMPQLKEEPTIEPEKEKRNAIQRFLGLAPR